MSKLKMIELFSGIGSQAQAMKEVGIDFESLCCEIDEKAYKSYCAIHGDTPNLGDITKIEHLPDCDLLFYSFPCGPRGTKILTNNGYKNIEDVVKGDFVLTHQNRYKEVSETMSRTVDKVYKIKALGTQLKLTENHPLYVYRDGVFKWVSVKDLQKTDKLAYNICKTEEDCNISKEMMWILGRYVADGYVNKYLSYSTEFAIGIKKKDDFEAHIPIELKDRFKACPSHPTCIQYRIADKEIQQLCIQFGNGSTKKHIPWWVLNLPRDKLQSFFDGYMSGDGHVRVRSGTTQLMFSTVSEEIFLGLQMIVAKLYGKICSLYIRHDHRKETFNDGYCGQVNINCPSRDQRIIEDKIIVPIREISEIKGEIDVFNFSVLDDESYTMNNIIVHNCTDISMAGKREGFTEGSGTRSSLLWEVKRLLLDMKERERESGLPLTLIMENVKALTFKKNLPEFNKWIEFLNSLGYTSVWKVLNAKDYGTPQNRERVFLVSRLDGKVFKFPEPCPDGRVLRDVLEKEVPENFYLSADKIAHYEQHRIRQEENDRGFGWQPKSPDVIAKSITANADRHCSNFVVEENEPIKAGNLHLESTFGQANDVHSVDGVAPTLTTCHVGIGQPKIEIAGEFNDANFTQHKRVYSPEDIAPTVLSRDWKTPKKIEVAGVMNNSNVVQDKQVYSDEGVSPAVIGAGGSGSKIKIEIAGDLHRFGENKTIDRVYNSDKIAPTIITAGGGSHYPKIQVVGDLHIPGETETNNRVHSPEGLSPTVRASHTPKMMDKSEETPHLQKGDAASMLTPGREKKHQNGPRYKKDGTSFTITCQDRHGVVQNDGKEIRIRYLTPRECWRLQGFPDYAFDAAVSAGMSKTALYSQAGNSIAVPVLKAIFKGLYIDNSFEPEKKEWF